MCTRTIHMILRCVPEINHRQYNIVKLRRLSDRSRIKHNAHLKLKSCSYSFTSLAVNPSLYKRWIIYLISFITNILVNLNREITKH